MRHDGGVGASPRADLVDIFIVLLLASALDIFVFTIATQFIGNSAFLTLPSFLTDAYSSIWASVASGAAGIGLVVVKSLSASRPEKPNYILLVLLTAAALLAAIIAIAIAARWLNPRPFLQPPPGVALIDPSKNSAAPQPFEFVSLPGSTVAHRLKGSYSVKNREVSGAMTAGVVVPTEAFNPAFPQSVTKLTFRACYIHPVYGSDQMDVFPVLGKSDNSVDLKIPLEKNHSYKLPPMSFSFQLPVDARPNRTWLCAAIENSLGYMPAQ